MAGIDILLVTCQMHPSQSKLHTTIVKIRNPSGKSTTMVLIYIYNFFIYVKLYIYNFIYMFNHTYIFYTHIWVCMYILTNMLWEMINKPTKHLSQIKSRTQKNTGRTTKKRKWIEQNVSGKTRMIFLHCLCNKNKINRIGQKQL